MGNVKQSNWDNIKNDMIPNVIDKALETTTQSNKPLDYGYTLIANALASQLRSNNIELPDNTKSIINVLESDHPLYQCSNQEIKIIKNPLLFAYNALSNINTYGRRIDFNRENEKLARLIIYLINSYYYKATQNKKG